MEFGSGRVLSAQGILVVDWQVVVGAGKQQLASFPLAGHSRVGEVLGLLQGRQWIAWDRHQAGVEAERGKKLLQLWDRLQV